MLKKFAKIRCDAEDFAAVDKALEGPVAPTTRAHFARIAFLIRHLDAIAEVVGENSRRARR